MDMIDISKLDKAEVLAVLYNASKPQGMGFMQYDPKPMTKDEAGLTLGNMGYDFDYLKGRVMKIDLSGDELDPNLYDRDNGLGAAQRAIDELIKASDVNTDEIAKTHRDKTLESAENLKPDLSSETKVEPGVITLGLSDVADKLSVKIDEAEKAHKEQ